MRSVRLHAARVTQVANALDGAARALKQLANDPESGSARAATTALDALPIPEDIHRAFAELIGERTRQAEAHEQAARLDLLE
jgi:uncharacterized protein YdeI (YjbR/CyaY-like superfamily)